MNNAYRKAKELEDQYRHDPNFDVDSDELVLLQMISFIYTHDVL